MAQTRTARTPATAVTPPTDNPTAPPAADEVTQVTSWQYQGDEPPPVEWVRDRLASLPERYSTRAVDYIDHVLPMQNTTKVKVPNPDNPTGAKIVQSVSVWTLYVQVAGRLLQALDAAERNGWHLDIEPYLGEVGYTHLTDTRVVYREVVRFRTPEGQIIGERTGTASSKLRDADSAEGTNPYEVVETSARGRALGAWGFGVLPGSGIASADEIRAAARAAAMLEADNRNPGRRRGRPAAQNREQMLSDVYALAAELAELTRTDIAVIGERLGTWAEGMIGAPNLWNATTKRLNWDALNDGQVHMVAGRLRELIQDTQDGQR